MAGGALVQLVSCGVPDLYLVGDPQITFFKVLYRRHTNFAIESIPQTFSAPADFGETVSCSLARIGDLVGKIFLYVQIPAIAKFIDSSTGEENDVKKIAWVRNLGYALILDIMIEIGGKKIDKQYGEWLYIWSQVSGRQDDGLDKMVGNIPQMYQFSNGKKDYELFIPLEFWFCRHNGLALPITALAASEVKLTVSFRRLEECYRLGPTHSMEMLDDVVPFKMGDYIEQTINHQTIYGYVVHYDYVQKKLFYIKIQSPTSPQKAFEAPNQSSTAKSYRIYQSLSRLYANPKPNAREMTEQSSLPSTPKFLNAFFYVNYIYLDREERARFSKTHHEYLIEQIQFNQVLNVQSPHIKQKLALHHPCKSHYWVVQLDGLVGPGTINDLFNYTTSYIGLDGTDIVRSAQLVLNGVDRFPERSVEYFNLIEPYEHHYRGPAPGINFYSFGLNPEDYQPSAATNMSEIEHIIMKMRLNNMVNSQHTAKIRSYTVNYNILRVCFQMGGLGFDQEPTKI